MERRDFLKLAFGVAAGVGAVAVTGSAMAAPLMAPTDLKGPVPDPKPDVEAKPAIATEKDVDEASAEQVQYYGYGYRRRYYRRYYRPRYYRRRRSYYY